MVVKGKDARVTSFTKWTDESDLAFADKLEKWDIQESYREEAEKRGITLKELYVEVLREHLEALE